MSSKVICIREALYSAIRSVCSVLHALQAMILQETENFHWKNS